jgi:quinol monooxygenase YgiN
VEGGEPGIKPHPKAKQASARPHVAPTLKERGCINYDLHDSPDQPGVLVFLENWESKADLDAHLASPHIDAFRAKAPDLLAEPPDITLWRELKGA